MASSWISLYNDCYNKKQEFDKYYGNLNFLTNDGKEPCKDFNKMKDFFWDTDTKREFKDNDLEFNENVKISGNDAVSDACRLRCTPLKDEDIINERGIARAKLIDAAKKLREATIKLLDLKITQDDVDKLFGFFRWRALPDDFKKKMFNAISKDKCKELPFYTVSDRYKDLNVSLNNVLTDMRTGCHRAFCLNLLKELKLDKNRAIPQGAAQPPDEPKVTDLSTANEGEILHADTWKAYVDSLQAMPAIKTDSKTFGQTIKDAFLKQFTEMKESTVDLKKSYDEMNAWADGNPGGILFGANKNTYRISPKDTGEFEVIKIESLKPIETFTAAEAGKDDKEGKAKALNSI